MYCILTVLQRAFRDIFTVLVSSFQQKQLCIIAFFHGIFVVFFRLFHAIKKDRHIFQNESVKQVIIGIALLRMQNGEARQPDILDGLFQPCLQSAFSLLFLRFGAPVKFLQKGNACHYAQNKEQNPQNSTSDMNFIVPFPK